MLTLSLGPLSLDVVRNHLGTLAIWRWEGRCVVVREVAFA